MNAARVGRATRLVTAAALVCATLLAVQAAHPPRADAWAWKDTCILIGFNQTGTQSSVRPVLYTPLLPSPTAMAVFVAFAAVGLPTNEGTTFSNFGIPVPTYGCHTLMQFINPGVNVSCAYNAPTTGANHFDCNGTAKVTITKDDDDIVGEVRFGFGAPDPIDPTTDADGDGDSDSHAPPTLDPATQPPALRPSELPGDDWVTSQDPTDLGRAGQLMMEGDPPAGCSDTGDLLAPSVVRASLLTRHGGAEGVGAVDQLQANAADAAAAVRDVLSAKSMSCLSQLLASGDPRSDVSLQSVPDRLLGDDASGRRLRIKRGDSTDYLDIIAQASGRHAQVLMLAGDDDPLPGPVTLAALRRVGGS